MFKYDVSICLPGIRTHLWEKLYNSAIEAVGEHTFEMIIVGPYEPPESLKNKENFKFFKDYGAPARCAQIAVSLAESEFMMWASDDGYFLPNTISECIQLFRTTLSEKDEITIRYSEGTGHSGRLPDDSYWIARTHADQRLAGVKDSYRIAPVGFFKTEYFKWLGGWDCRYEHLNMCCHDLSFRVQNNGGKIVLSPSEVLKCDYNPATGDHVPVFNAYHKNDAPLFSQQWSLDQSRRIQIDFSNWTKSPSKWIRRFS